MRQDTDLEIGQKYGIWTIIEDTGEVTIWGEKIYKARSDHGEERIVWHSHIKYGGAGHSVKELNKRVVRKPAKRRTLNITEALSKEKLEDLYLIQNKSLQDIATEHGCTRQAIYELMKKYGLQRRKKSEARVLAIKKGKFEDFEYYNIDEEFFSKWSPEMAWVLGLLFTDGSVGKNRVILTSVDLALLEKVKRHLKSTKPIIKYPQGYNKSKYLYHFGLYREKMREDLDRLGLIPQKSLTMRFPDVPQQYIRHFIRGCWDGDGSVYLERKDKLRANFVSGSKKFITRIVLELYKIGIGRYGLREPAYIKPMTYLRNGTTIHTHRTRNAYYIKIGGEKCERLFHYFYDGVDESLYLKRKYEVFKNGLDVLKKRNNKLHTLDRLT